MTATLEQIDPALARSLHSNMVRIRCFEERVSELFLAGRLPGFVHTYLGEEAVAVGACAALEAGDRITSTHRGHGHGLAKGMEMGPLMSELFGKETGACQGRGGSMHVADFEVGMLGANGIVGGGFGIAAGAALADSLLRTDTVTLCFFGDGAINKGTFHEALNFAALKRLPVIYLCENNRYAQYTAIARTTSVEDLSIRASAYGIPGLTVDGNDAGAVFRVVSEAVSRARSGEGPTLIVADTYRFGGHFIGDAEVYRSADEVAEWRQQDPVNRLETTLMEAGHLSEAGRDAVWAEARAEVEAAERFAEESPLPDPATALDYVFSPPAGDGTQSDGEEERVSFGQATVAAMEQAMKADERVIVLGEDISWGGNFGQFRGLAEQFGPDRVIDMPISEATIVSVAVGAAVRGMRPVASMSFVEFALGAMDEIVNQASKFRYMFGGQASVPLVLRASDGILRSSAAQHSESFEALFAHIPGLKVVAPSNPGDAKGLLRSAIADDNPVVYLENKKIGMRRAMAPIGDHWVPLGKAAVRRAGHDLTIVAYSIMAVHAEAASQVLADEDGIEAEVIDLRSLVPLDLETLIASVRRTRRALVAHEAWTFGGFGAEVAASLTERLWGDLAAPVLRVGAQSSPIPFSPPLERAVVPEANEIVEAARRLMAYR
ncbi:MAG TPA: dehydrogenase E1 component subunit alpha/beta [Acidimicrobiia bacterium]|nr:dehydrogenase E1 component subunit alpha/beta [Acidimicrobiia bacterium]